MRRGMSIVISADTEDLAHNVSRRGIIAGILTLPALSHAVADVDPFEKVRRDADALAASMAAIHGGRFWIHIDHESGCAAVSLVLS